MARKSRIHYKGAFYHVIIRGNNKHYVFQADEMKKNTFKEDQEIYRKI